MALFANRYELERVVGKGATATVHKAVDTTTNAVVAVKVLRPEITDPASVRRFQREIARTAELSHPLILPVLDSGEFEGQPFFTLPFMEAGTLRQRLDRESQMAIDDILSIVAQVSEALDYAHARGLVHRDVKPENILFSSGKAHLGDFGIARALQNAYGDGTASSVAVRGTPAYMSPEQAAGSETLDGRSDVFSLACVTYECITGMRAFIGPTPESVVAQRFAFTPREIRAYRPSASPALERALVRAFALSPADRYRSAGDFADAMRQAAADDSPAPVVAPRAMSRRTQWFIGATAAAAAIAVLGYGAATDSLPWQATALDTTRVVVLPFDGIAGGEDLLAEGLQRYRGLSVAESFAVADAVRRRGGVASLDEAKTMALSLGAGRYIRGRIITLGAERFAYAAYIDTRSNAELHHARVPLSADSSLLVAAFAKLADSLVLRGATTGAASGTATVNLAVVEAMARARRSLAEWNLLEAESQFSRAADIEPTSGRAHLWLAQVRVWKGDPQATWKGNAERAIADSVSLTPIERRHADALFALASDRFPAACAAYQRITAANSQDFAAWYGLGECHRGDRQVVADARSPSGWSFRSSYYRGMLAYQRAFEVFPTSYRGFQSNAFQSLQRLLYASPRLRQGLSADTPPKSFLAWATARGDSIEFVPYPADQVMSGVAVPDSALMGRALRRSRQVFQSIAASWAASLPRSAGAKEAVAIALELNGDLDGALDSLRAARAIQTDTSQALRLTAQEVMVGVKLGVLRGVSQMTRAVALADSLLRNSTPRGRADAELLMRLALLLGRCEQASQLARQAAVPMQGTDNIPPGLLTATYAVLPGVALGCTAPAQLRLVSDRLATLKQSETERTRAEYTLIGAAVRQAFPENPDVIARLARATTDFLLVAEDSMLKGNLPGARRHLERTLARRAKSVSTDFPVDAALAEARIWLALKDTTIATTLLDRALQTIVAAEPTASGNAIESINRAAALARVLLLRAELAAARGQPAGRWAALVTEMWSTADPALRPSLRRARELSSKEKVSKSN